MGRPTKLTPRLRKRLLDLIAQGAYVEQAARAVNIAPSTFYAWKERGEAGEQPYAEFLEALRAREALAETECVGLLRAAGETDWRAVAALMERRWPDRWGRRREADHRVEVVGAVPGGQSRDLSRLTVDERRTLLDLLTKAEPDPPALRVA